MSETPSSEKDAPLFGRRYCQVAVIVCAVFGLVILGTVVVALFDPPPWNRAERFSHAWAWLYVAALHWQLARVIPPAGGTSDE